MNTALQVDMTVKIRTRISGHEKKIRECAKQLNGKTYTFIYGWVQDKFDPYPGEIAYLPMDKNYPQGAPIWISSGDLVKRG